MTMDLKKHGRNLLPGLRAALARPSASSSHRRTCRPRRPNRLRLPEPCCCGDCQHPCPSPSRLSGLLGMRGALAGDAAAAARNWQHEIPSGSNPSAGLTPTPRPYRLGPSERHPPRGGPWSCCSNWPWRVGSCGGRRTKKHARVFCRTKSSTHTRLAALLPTTSSDGRGYCFLRPAAGACCVVGEVEWARRYSRHLHLVRACRRRCSLARCADGRQAMGLRCSLLCY